jgi:hypothetical protein
MAIETGAEEMGTHIMIFDNMRRIHFFHDFDFLSQLLEPLFILAESTLHTKQ